MLEFKKRFFEEFINNDVFLLDKKKIKMSISGL